MVLKLLGTLIEPTDRYSTKTHRVSAVVLTKLIKIVVGSITPASFVTFAYLVYLYFRHNYQLQLLTASIWTWTPNQWCFLTAGIWSLMEIGFYLHCLNVKRLFAKTSSTPELTWTKRLLYLQRVLDHNPHVYKTLTKWFHKRNELNAEDDVQLEHIKDWLSWAFFNKMKKNLTSDELGELDAIVKICLQIDPTLDGLDKEGKSPGDYKPMKFMRLNLDPIQVQHKPLIAYVVSSQ